MSKITIHDRKGNKVGTYNVESTDFADRINKQLLHDAVVMYQANRRQGSHKTKTRGEVSGSTKKMYRQKGTGNARAGHKRSGVRRGGGHIFALKNRDYSYSLPRKALRLATRMAMASKIADDELVVIDELKFEAPKTKDMAQILKNLGCDKDSVLVATAASDENAYKSGRNIERVRVERESDLNAYLLLSSRKVLFTKAALDAMKSRHAVGGASGAEEAAAS